MEKREIFNQKLKDFRTALVGFKETLSIDVLQFNPIVQDAILNGRIRKFEYCSELTWKSAKDNLLLNHGIDVKSPKDAIKKNFSTGTISENAYNGLMDMIDDRNRLSHIYKKNIFREILSKIGTYYDLMIQASIVISPQT